MCQKNKASFEVDYNTLFMINERLKLIDDVNLKIKILNEVLDNYDASTSKANLITNTSKVLFLKIDICFYSCLVK